MKARPSNANLWSQCSASLLAADQPFKLDLAEKGIELHKQAEKTLKEGEPVRDDAVMEYIDVLQKHPKIWVEQEVNIPTLNNAVGKIDSYSITDDQTEVDIYDFKTGQGYVDAYQNPQLMLYAEGLLQLYPGLKSFRVHIVQPNVYRKDSLSSFSFKVSALFEKMTELRKKLDEAKTGQHKFTTGIHCRYCPFRAKCVSFQQANVNVLDLLNVPFMEGEATTTMLDQERDLLLRAKTMLTARLDALEDTLVHRLSNGDTSSQLMLAETYGRKTWNVPIHEVIQAVSKEFRIDISKLDCLTPAQAYKKVPKRRRDDFYSALDSLIHTSKKPKLMKRDATIAAKLLNYTDDA